MSLIKQDETGTYRIYDANTNTFAEEYPIGSKLGQYDHQMTHTNMGNVVDRDEIKADIVDETGAIADVAVILAGEEISIKNIGIVHNREFEHGVLGIEFYDSESLKRASQVLSDRAYRVYEV